MVALTVVTGFVDAYSYLELGHVFVANMTGNVVFCGFAIAGQNQFSLLASVSALAAFAVGAIVGGRMRRFSGEHRGRLLHATVLAEFGLMAAAYFLAQLGPATTGPGPRYTLIALLGLAMGVQNAAARMLAVPDLTTTVLTMTITGTGVESKAAGGSGGSGGRNGRRLLSIAAMFLGALLGTLAILHGHPGVSLLCALVLLACAALATARIRSSKAAWTRL